MRRGLVYRRAAEVDFDKHVAVFGGQGPQGRLAAGHAFVQNIRRGHCELATDVLARHRIRLAFDQLTTTS